MPADFSKLQDQINKLAAQVAATETIEASAVRLLNGQADAIKQAVTAALEADNAADNNTVAAASAAIDTVNARFVASAGKLGDAVTANTPPPPPPPPAAPLRT